MRSQEDSSSIYWHGASPETRVAISQKNRVFSKPFGALQNFLQVGVLSTFDWSEARTINPVRGVGFGDRVQELVPAQTDPAQLTLNRTLLYTASLAQELGYRGGVDGLVRSLRHHKWPFDIRSELVFSSIVTNNGTVSPYAPGVIPQQSAFDQSLCIVTFFMGCWLNNMSISYPADGAIVAENCSATAMDITDGVNWPPQAYGDNILSGNNPFLPATDGSSVLYTLSH
jgi:hypothetical protein